MCFTPSLTAPRSCGIPAARDCQSTKCPKPIRMGCAKHPRFDLPHFECWPRGQDLRAKSRSVSATDPQFVSLQKVTDADKGPRNKLTSMKILLNSIHATPFP